MTKFGTLNREGFFGGDCFIALGQWKETGALAALNCINVRYTLQSTLNTDQILRLKHPTFTVKSWELNKTAYIGNRTNYQTITTDKWQAITIWKTTATLS